MEGESRASTGLSAGSAAIVSVAAPLGSVRDGDGCGEGGSRNSTGAEKDQPGPVLL